VSPIIHAENSEVKDEFLCQGGVYTCAESRRMR
jgi:hypothetical protein